MIDVFSRILTRMVLGVAVFVLALMMFLTAADVVLRYVFNRSLPGTFEIVEYIMAIFIPFSIAFCAERKGHVAVDLIIQHFPHGVQRSAFVVTQLLSLFFVFTLSFLSFLYVADTLHSRVCSAVLLIPAYPFVIPTGIGVGIFTLLLVRDLVDLQFEEKKEEK